MLTINLDLYSHIQLEIFLFNWVLILLICHLPPGMPQVWYSGTVSEQLPDLWIVLLFPQLNNIQFISVFELIHMPTSRKALSICDKGVLEVFMLLGRVVKQMAVL